MANFAEDAAFEMRGSPRKAERKTAEPALTPAGATTAADVTTPAATVLGLQRSVGNAGTTAFLQRRELDEEGASGTVSPVHEALASGGSPLDRATRATMESHLGTDLGDVRLHVDRHSAESVQAAAYTVGNDVVVNPDHFQAGTASAQRTLAHELTHVVQQRSGPVDGSERAGGIKVSDPSDRFEREAESSADRFMSAAETRVGSVPSASGAGVAQRQKEEEEPVQALALQRAAEEEESESEQS